ncbi:hypothetical protein M409DRAFT_68034 [Zasmidium cellare ATCC 36951]|uniref:WLM domain-containing protein n=1 Tax=Zasmidium cellare ATCC 36951 TaxID=1080233 RepID=A0A6A6CAB6_ZASCE|nr:uncharacterized protein M409DRAFT_68034 [Zasmidium cellare ATCC 36951]KAF2164104.1 hypothetical protein M409DRAFT_68034 [Zasmidium cellare ATCC 36951]
MSWRPPGPPGNPHSGPGFTGRNRQSSNGGPSGVSRSSASQLREHESLFTSYEHLQGLPRADSALTMLRKVASLVKPIMRKRGWRVQVLAEFLPPEQNLLGLNINKGYKICIRLRYPNNPDLFLPLEQVVDTMLHELSHNVWGEHDSNFHKLWDELRDEHEALARKGYTGEGFLGEGKKLGGTGYARPPPLHEMRQRARASAEKRKTQSTLGHGSGQRLGGTPLHAHGRDVREVIADQVSRRNTINRGCGSGRSDASQLAEQASNNTFKTKAEEDDANNRAIAQALMELMEEEEAAKLNGDPAKSGAGLAWDPKYGLHDASMSIPEGPKTSNGHEGHPSEEEQLKWAMQESMNSSAPGSGGLPAQPIRHEMLDEQQFKRDEEPLIDLTSIPEANDAEQDSWTCEVCTLVNPLQYLSCDACGVERPQSVMARNGSSSRKMKSEKTTKTSRAAAPGAFGKGKREMPAPKQNESLGWKCQCGAFMEHKWWTCSACGSMKTSS